MDNTIIVVIKQCNWGYRVNTVVEGVLIVSNHGLQHNVVILGVDPEIFLKTTDAIWCVFDSIHSLKR